MQDYHRLPQDLIKGCLGRDRKAEFTLYRLCHGLCAGVCRRYGVSTEDIGDVVNRSFMKILNGLDGYEVDKDYRPWVKTIAVRTAIDYHRKKSRTPISRDIDEAIIYDGDHLSTINEYELTFDAEELLLMIETLPPTTKQVFNLFAIDGFKHREIADLLEMNENTSKWHVASARKALQKKIKHSTLKKRVGHEETVYRRSL